MNPVEYRKSAPAPSSEVDLFELFALVWSYKWRIAAFTAAMTAAAAVGVNFMTPKYESTATFLIRQEKQASPFEAWGSLAEQFGYKVRGEADPLLSMMDRVLKSESFYAPLMEQSLNPAFAESSMVSLFKMDSVPAEDRAEVFTARVLACVKVKEGADKVYTLKVATPIPGLSYFLANGIIDRLTHFFNARQASEQERKLIFLQSELSKNRREMDSASNTVRVFLEANKDFSSPLLSFRYQTLKRDEAIYSEKFMVTMKAYQSLAIAASQAEFNFEKLQPPKLARNPSKPNKPKLVAAASAASLLFGSALVVAFRWLVVVRRRDLAA